MSTYITILLGLKKKNNLTFICKQPTKHDMIMSGETNN